MKVNFFATLRQIVGQKTIEIDLPENSSVQDFLQIIVTQYPAMHKELLDKNGNLYRHVHIFVNGRDAPFLENGMATIIQPDDTLNVFPAVGGG